MPADGGTSKTPDPTANPADELAPGADSSALDRKSSLIAGGSKSAATKGRPPAAARARSLRGLIVDAVGQPVNGAYVYQGTFSNGRFAPGSGFTTTGPDGRFTLTCNHGPVLLTPWPINVPISAASLGSAPGWAARFLGKASTFPNPAPCTKQRNQIVVRQGAVVKAKTAAASECQDIGRLRLRLNGNLALSLVVNGLADGADVTLPGVPVGTHALNTGLDEQDVTISSSGEQVVTRGQARLS